MADIVFRRAALRDLQTIGRRIAAEDFRAASRFRTTVVQRLELLRRIPESARPRPEFGTDIRTLPIGSYIVILRVQLPQVIVLRIIHGARDLARLFQPDR